MAKVDYSSNYSGAITSNGKKKTQADYEKERREIANKTADQLQYEKGGTTKNIATGNFGTTTPGTTGGSGGSGGSSGGTSSYSYSYTPYTESQAVINARNAMNNWGANRIADWTGGTYGTALQSAMDRIMNRDKFSYDMNADALYQQYKDKYINLGQMAMQDTMGQASSMTGGYGNSYAATAGNQSYQTYLQGLNDKVPELYELAYSKYNQEGQDLYDQYNMYNNAYSNEYGEYQDKVNNWYTEYNRLANDYYNLYNQDYGLYSDNYSRAISESQYAQDMALKQAQLQETIRSNQASEKNALDKAAYETKIAELTDALNNSTPTTEDTKDYGAYSGAIYSKGNYSSVLSDIQHMDKTTARDYVKAQWADGNITTQEYNELVNKIRG